MAVDPGLVAELRTMFAQGATPSRLIKHIVSHHEGEQRLRFLIEDYFETAFSVPLVRVPTQVGKAATEMPHLNTRVLHQMVEKRHTWHETNEKEPSWLDSLAATDELELINQVQPKKIPELASSWPYLDQAARAYVQRNIGNVNTLHERVLMLAALAERLQQKVLELEAERVRI